MTAKPTAGEPVVLQENAGTTSADANEEADGSLDDSAPVVDFRVFSPHCPSESRMLGIERLLNLLELALLVLRERHCASQRLRPDASRTTALALRPEYER